MRAASATEKGYFKDEIIPVVIPATKKTPEIVFASDEFLRQLAVYRRKMLPF